MCVRVCVSVPRPQLVEITISSVFFFLVSSSSSACHLYANEGHYSLHYHLAATLPVVALVTNNFQAELC